MILVRIVYSLCTLTFRRTSPFQYCMHTMTSAHFFHSCCPPFTAICRMLQRSLGAEADSKVNVSTVGGLAWGSVRRCALGVIYQHLALTLAMRRNLVFLPCVDFRRSVEIASISERERRRHGFCKWCGAFRCGCNGRSRSMCRGCARKLSLQQA